MATNTFASVKSIVPEQNTRAGQRPNFGTRWFNGIYHVAGTVDDASSPGLPLAGRRMRLFTDTGILIDETYSAVDGTYNFPNIRSDINDMVDHGLIVTKQREGLDGYAQMRDRLVAVSQ